MTEKQAYAEYEAKLAELNQARSEYIAVGDYRGGTITSPAKAFDDNAGKMFARLRDELNERWHIYIEACERGSS